MFLDFGFFVCFRRSFGDFVMFLGFVGLELFLGFVIFREAGERRENEKGRKGVYGEARAKKSNTLASKEQCIEEETGKEAQRSPSERWHDTLRAHAGE